MNGQGCPDGESSSEDKTGNWLKLHRGIEKSRVFADDWLTRLWIWCLVRANFTDQVFLGVDIPAGSFSTSMEGAGEALGKNKSTVCRGLQKLESLGMIETRTEAFARHKFTVVSITNWNNYQSKKLGMPAAQTGESTDTIRLQSDCNQSGISQGSVRDQSTINPQLTEERKEYKQFQEGEDSSATPPPESTDDIAELEAARLMGSTWESPEFEKFIAISPRSVVRKRAGIAYQASVPRVLLQLRRDNPTATAKQAHEFLLQKFRQWAESPVGSTPPQPDSPDYRSEVHRWLENEEWNNSPDRLRFGGNMEFTARSPKKPSVDTSEIDRVLSSMRSKK